jgi:hypothetical protein
VASVADFGKSLLGEVHVVLITAAPAAAQRSIAYSDETGQQQGTMFVMRVYAAVSAARGRSL